MLPIKRTAWILRILEHKITLYWNLTRVAWPPIFKSQCRNKEPERQGNITPLKVSNFTRMDSIVKCRNPTKVFQRMIIKIHSVLMSLNHFELILVQGDRHGSSFSILQMNNHFSQQHLLKRLSFLCCIFLAPL
jgi:hypothetical protein